MATRDAEFNDRKMLYRQTKDYILEQIQQGTYGPGTHSAGAGACGTAQNQPIHSTQSDSGACG